jgi:hypothetical protein
MAAASQVLYVTNKTICSKLLPTYNAQSDRTPPITPSGSLYLVQVGSMYLAWDPVKTTEGRADFLVFDNKHKFASANLY